MNTCFVFLASILTIITNTWQAPAAIAENAATRQLLTATCSYDLNEPSALQSLGNGADINWQNPAMSEETMLITAIKGLVDAKNLEFLLKHGANPNLKDSNGKSALDYAIQYNIGKSAEGRRVLALLQNKALASGSHHISATSSFSSTVGSSTMHSEAAVKAPTIANSLSPVTRNTPGGKQAKEPVRGVDPLSGATATGGGPTPAEVKKTMEDSFRSTYGNHFVGVQSKVAIEWLAPIQVGSKQERLGQSFYPVKVQVRVTAEDPRDGNRSTVTRGINADYGYMKKREMFRFFKNGFGEWEFAMYEI